jgi:hypothetical protein
MLAQERRKRESRVGIQESDSGEIVAGIETGIARRTVAYRLRDVKSMQWARVLPNRRGPLLGVIFRAAKSAWDAFGSRG